METCIDWWGHKRKEIADLIQSGTPLSNFYMWRPIIETMWSTTDGYAVHQIKFLTGLPDWESRWLPAIKDKLKVTECQWWPNVSFASISHAYYLAHFEKVAQLHLDEMKYIFEFGAGTGNMCRIIHNLGFSGTYEICDFPEMQELQRFFIDESGVDISKIRWMDKVQDAHISNQDHRLLISIAAIEETSLETQAEFVKMGMEFQYFLMAGGLMAGVHSDLRDATCGLIDWKVRDTNIPPGCYIGIGNPLQN